MPKMINPAIGWCACPVCGTRGNVKRFAVRALNPNQARRGGRLYVECREHGTFTSAAPGFQDWILERAELWGPEGQPVAVPDPPTPAKPNPAPLSAAMMQDAVRKTVVIHDEPTKHVTIQNGKPGWGFFS